VAAVINVLESSRQRGHVGFESSVGKTDVITLHRHRIGFAGYEYAVQRVTEVTRSCGLRIVWIIRKNLEQWPSNDLFTGRMGCLQPGVGGNDHRELRRVGSKNQQNVR